MSDNMFVLDIAGDFNTLPQGRYHSGSPNCAEALFIMIQDALDYYNRVEVRFNDMKIAAVEDSFLDHLAQMVVNNHYSGYVTITSDNDWVISRYNKYFNNHYDKWRFG